MADTKGGYLSADEFIAAIAGETIDHELKVDNRVVGKVQIRSLGLREVQDAIVRYKDAQGELTLWALDNGLANPPLSDTQRESVRVGKPGPLLELATHIMTVSGMTNGKAGDDSPLDGSGS